MSLTVTLFLIFLSPSTVQPIAVMSAIAIANQSIELVNNLVDLWEIFNRYTHIVDMPMTEQEVQFMKKLDNINTRLDEMNDNLNTLVKEVNTVAHLLKHLPDTFQYEFQLTTITNHQIFINTQFKKMEKYVQYRTSYENSTLINFSDEVISSNRNSVSSLMKMTADFITNGNFLKLLQQQLQETQVSIFCNGEQSPQQVFHSMLNEVLLTNSKAFITVQVAYLFQKLHGRGNFTREIQDATEDFKGRTDNFIRIFKRFMSSTSTELWRCDPQRHIPDETYVELTGLVQGYILNEMNLNKDGSCSESCETYSYTKKHNCSIDKWCNRQPKPNCLKVIDCKFVADEMKVCRANETSPRRYEYVEFKESAKTYGLKKSCKKSKITNLHSYKEDSIWTWSCSYCFCLCFSGPTLHSDIFINLRATLADVKNNKVVTGLRFIKHNRIVRLQIQEGQLLPRGQIDLATVRWVPPEDYHILDEDIYAGQDFHIFNWDKRGIDLGVRFKRVGDHVDLDVLITPFNFTTGKLHERQSFFRHSRNSRLRHKFGKELKLSKPDLPIRVGSSIPDDSRAAYVKFINSDFEKDAAQSTVPFFDAQPVQSSTPTPLSGVGIFHKGREGSGGFIAPKIITYDFSQHLHPVFQISTRKKRSIL